MARAQPVFLDSGRADYEVATPGLVAVIAIRGILVLFHGGVVTAAVVDDRRPLLLEVIIVVFRNGNDV